MEDSRGKPTEVGKKTTVLSLYGGPGSGKSTSAAFMFAELKHNSVNAELVREYVKDNWAWEKRPIGVFDQFYFLGKQIRREAQLFGKVDYVVTDSPVWLVAYYAERYARRHIRHATMSAVMGYYEQARVEGHEHVHIWVRRSKAYNQAGRYETEEQARHVDSELRPFLEGHGIQLKEVDTDPRALAVFVHQLIGGR